MSSSVKQEVEDGKNWVEGGGAICKVREERLQDGLRLTFFSSFNDHRQIDYRLPN